MLGGGEYGDRVRGLEMFTLNLDSSALCSVLVLQKVEQALQGSGHSTEDDRVQESSGKPPQAYRPIWGSFCTDSGVRFDDPCGSLASQDIL